MLVKNFMVCVDGSTRTGEIRMSVRIREGKNGAYKFVDSLTVMVVVWELVDLML